MELLSIEVGDRRIRVILLEKDNGVITLLKEAVKAIPSPEDPKIQGVKFLRDFVKENKVSTRKIHLTIADPDIIVIKNTALPEMRPEELISAITWHAKEEGSVSDECRLFNYDVVKKYTDEDTAKKAAVVYTVVNHKELDAYLVLLRRAGFEVLKVSALPFDHANVLMSVSKEGGVQAVLDVEHDHSTLAIYRQGKMIFFRNLGFSYAKAKTVLNDPLFLGEKYRTAEAEAEIVRAIRTFGIPAGEDGISEGHGQFFALMRPLIEGLVREMRYSLTYFMSNMEEEKPATLFVTGYGTEFKGLNAYFSKELGMNASCLKLPENVRSRSENGAEELLENSRLVGAIAGIFAGNDVVDFTPLDFKSLKMEAAQRKALSFISMILVGVLATSFFFIRVQHVFFENRLRLGQRQLLALGKIAEASSTVFPRYYLTQEIDRATVPADKVLRLLGHLFPKEVVLTRVVVDSSRRHLEMDVTAALPEADKETAVQGLVQRLKETSFFSRVSVRPEAAPGGTVFRIEGEFRDD